MKKISLSNKIYVSKSKIPGADRGVFAKSDFKKGETIETCPILEIPKQEIENLENSVLVSYIYFFGKQKERLLVALGFGSIYNHSYAPNAVYKINSVEKEIEFISTKKIKIGEEITVNYIQGNRAKIPLWFEV